VESDKEEQVAEKTEELQAIRALLAVADGENSVISIVIEIMSIAETARAG